MTNIELQKWINWLGSINFIRVNLEVGDTEKGIIAKFRRFVGPQNFDERFETREDIVNWFHIKLTLYAEQMSYEIVSEDFDRRDELRILSRIVDPRFTKATGDFNTMEQAISEMADKLDDLIENPTNYIREKLEEIPI